VNRRRYSENTGYDKTDADGKNVADGKQVAGVKTFIVIVGVRAYNKIWELPET
jgi:hypothetical protein